MEPGRDGGGWGRHTAFLLCDLCTLAPALNSKSYVPGIITGSALLILGYYTGHYNPSLNIDILINQPWSYSWHAGS